ncbi:hypothetical protein [Pseudomonas sp. NA-150]|uniref:hypothetical protein n=1 Tax=Pseudomonas sp. NA-150 TaxID=3367525 RepID=UPI0037C60A59
MRRQLVLITSAALLLIGRSVCAEGYGGTTDYGQPGSLTTPGYYSPRPSYMTLPPSAEPTRPSVDRGPAGQGWDPRYPGNPGFQRGPPQHYERQYDGHYGAGGGRGPWDRP